MSRGLQGRVSYELGSHSFCPCLSASGPQGSAVGPFHLPLFDLLNHSSHEAQRCTTLARANDGDAFEMRAKRDLSVGEEALWSYGSHGAAELLRTYGFVESSRNPYSTVMLTREEVAAAAVANSASLKKQPGDAKTAEARIQALEKAGRLPVVFTVRSDGDGNVTKVPEALLTAVQVLVMSKEEFGEWLAAGSIALGEGFLDEESLGSVVGCLLKISDSCLQRYPSAKAFSSGSSSHSSLGLMCKALKEEERQLILEFKKAVFLLAVAEEDVGEEGEEEELLEEEEEEVEEDEEDEEPAQDTRQAKKRRIDLA